MTPEAAREASCSSLPGAKCWGIQLLADEVSAKSKTVFKQSEISQVSLDSLPFTPSIFQPLKFSDTVPGQLQWTKSSCND